VQQKQKLEPAIALADEQLVSLVRSGDPDAFSTLYERYFRRIYHYVDKRLHNRADTEETVQEIFLNLFASLTNFRGDAPFASWAFGLARHVVANRFKKKRPPSVPLLDSDTGYPGLATACSSREPAPDESYEHAEQLSRVRHALEHTLSEEQRQLFFLHHLEHQSIEEIAQALHKSEDAVKSHLYRARKLLLAQAL